MKKVDLIYAQAAKADSGTASADTNSESIKQINRGESVKFKFPEK